MIRSLVKIGILLVGAILVYNYFFGTDTEKDNSRKIFGQMRDVVVSVGQLVKTEKNNFNAGKYDAARVELYLVDWSNVENRLLQRSGDIGEVRREGAAFAAEIRGLAHQLDQESGRIYAASCDADLGDTRCKFDLVAAGLQGEGSVASIESTSTIVATGLDTFAEGIFSGGRLTWSSGANDGLSVEIKEHRLASGHARLSLWQAMPEVIANSDSFMVSAGCDKRFATCRDRFANAANFRGFPHIPGNDFVIASPDAGAGNDGRSMAGGS